MADNGFQSVLLAPTQVLASQHYNELKEMAAQYNIDVVYIANGLKKKEREAILKSIEDGSALMIVGTHSVLSKEVKFHDLGLSITDEEHRFGVLQREEITTKAKAGMHTVTMSATPIPRSLSDVLLSTTEVFNIQSMPNGRKPIQTAICASQNTIFQFIKKEIEKGHQAYVVCPLIEDKQGVMEGILSVEQTYTEYASQLKETKIEKIEDGLLDRAVNEKDRYIFEKEYMNPKKEKYFHESMDGKIHSRVYEEIRTIVEEREDNTEEYDIEWEDDSREDDDLEYADAWDKNDNGIPDYAEDDR